MRRIIIHWTAGTNYPNVVDLEHYHFLIDKDGKIYNGKFPVSANENCRSDKNGKALYAAHTGGGNTGSIGIALCGMSGFNEKIKNTKFPLTKIQCDTLFKFTANIAEKYHLQVYPKTIMTHYEFGIANSMTSSFGKIDIIFLPPYPYILKNQVGDFIRTNIKQYFY